MAGWHVQEVSPAKGRGVLADRAHAPCEVVLDDQPYAWALIGDQLGGYCDCCLAPASQPLRWAALRCCGRLNCVQGRCMTAVRSPRRAAGAWPVGKPPPPTARRLHCHSRHPCRCSACKLACYASKEHQARAWRAGHREECAALRSCAPRAPPTAVRLALRCALRHWRAEQQQTAGGGQDDALRRHAELLGLRHHWERLPDGSKLQYAQMGALAHQLLRAAVPEAAERQGPRDLALLVARFAANSHTIADDELAPMAVGIYPLGAMVNHDCRPNAVHTFAAGGRMVFRWAGEL